MPEPPPRRRGRVAAIALAVGLVAAACSGDDEGDDAIALGEDGLAPGLDDVQPVDGVGDVAGLEVGALDGDGTIALADYGGAPVVVNFFARWCAPCVREMPEFQAVYEDLGGEVAFLGVSIDADAAEALALVEETGVTYDLGWDPATALYREFGGLSMPTTAIVDADGTVVDVFSGALTADDLLERLEPVRS